MKRKTVKKITQLASFAIILGLSCGIITSSGKSASVSASSVSDLEDMLAQLEERNQQIDNELAGLDSEIAENEKLQDLAWEKLQNTKDTIDYYNYLISYQNDAIAEKQSEIDTLSQNISDKEAEISAKQTDIDELKAENEENLKRFGEIVHAMYVTDNVDIFSVLSESSDIYDLLVRTKLFVNISQQNTRFMDELKQAISDTEQKIKDLENDVAQLDSDRNTLMAEQDELEYEKQDLENKQSEEQALSNQYSSEYDQYSNAISDYEDRQQALENEKKINKEEAEAYEAEIQRMIQEAQQNSQQEYEVGEWMWPVGRNFHYITTYFGYDPWRGGSHSGIDIGDAGINGTDIYASKAGTVIKAKNDYIPGYSYGKYIVIDHGDGYSTLYGHCSALYVYEGQQVNQGDVIGAVGSTGWSTGPHLHFEVRINGIAQDPFGYVTLP